MASSSLCSRGLTSPAQVAHRTPGARRTPQPAGFSVVAVKRVKKVMDVVLTKPVEGLGKAGEVLSVADGFFRNKLYPMGLAGAVTERLINEIAAAKASEEAAKAKAKAQAQEIATALQTIGKFRIKKTVGSDKSQIFGSVTHQDLADAIFSQTTIVVDKRAITIPDDIKTVGAYDVSVKLHPEVTANFSLVIDGVFSKDAGKA